MDTMTLIPQPCACGCGNLATVDERRKRVSKFLPGHNKSRLGATQSEAAREKIRAARAQQTNVRGGGPKPRPDAVRFFGHVLKSKACWNWSGACTPSGYGAFGTGSERDGTARIVRAHRFAYELLVGLIPVGLELDHTCNNRACVNPEHLEPVTHAENLRRGVERRRLMKGSGSD